MTGDFVLYCTFFYTFLDENYVYKLQENIIYFVRAFAIKWSTYIFIHIFSNCDSRKISGLNGTTQLFAVKHKNIVCI